MCLGIPGQVVEVLPGYADQIALVDVQGAKRNINIGMLDEPPVAGEWILIHMGFALETIDKRKADDAIEGLELMGQPREESSTDQEPRRA